MLLHVSCSIAEICSIGCPSRASLLALSASCCFCCSASCCLSQEVVLSTRNSFSGMARYFRMVAGDECSNSAISYTVRWPVLPLDANPLPLTNKWMSHPWIWPGYLEMLQAICWHRWPPWRESCRLSYGSQARPWPSHRRTFLEARNHPHRPFLWKLYPQWTVFLSRLQMLPLHAMISSLFKSLETFNKLNCIEVWMIFLVSRSVFFAFCAAKGCLSAHVLCGHSGL